MGAKVMIALFLGLMLGPVLALAVTPIFRHLRVVLYVPFARKRMLKNAIRQGHIVKATLIENNDVVHSIDNHRIAASNREVQVYQYDYQGKTYKYYGAGTTRPSGDVTLYFVNSPMRACVASELGLRERNQYGYYWVISAILTALVFIAVVFCK